jgi:hypothetical protein
VTTYIQGPARGKGDLIEAAGGTKIEPTGAPFDTDSGLNLVIVVSNEYFEAAAVVETERDYNDFTDPTDFRPKSFYAVPSDALAALLSN